MKRSICRPLLSAGAQRRLIQTTAAKDATPVFPTRPGPPPNPPTPSAEFPGEKVEQARRKARLMQLGQQLRPNPAKPATALQKRFWKDVHVTESPDGPGWQVYLDKRPVRTPDSKVPLTLPHAKKHLAAAIALEWDNLVSAQQALKYHHIPLTSLTARALDIQEADNSHNKSLREGVVKMLMGYLTTDTLLCWAPERSIHEGFESSSDNSTARGPSSLRQLQEATAKPIIEHMTTYVWPGVEIQPSLEEDSIMPQAQPEMTTSVIRGWLTGLPAWELAAVERAVLASKSLLVATRFVVDWSQTFADVRKAWAGAPPFGIEEAAQACTLEVYWQTRMWGEVEDTHDVEREDVRRQLGSALLLVHGFSP